MYWRVPSETAQNGRRKKNSPEGVRAGGPEGGEGGPGPGPYGPSVKNVSTGGTQVQFCAKPQKGASNLGSRVGLIYSDEIREVLRGAPLRNSGTPKDLRGEKFRLWESVSPPQPVGASTGPGPQPPAAPCATKFEHQHRLRRLQVSPPPQLRGHPGATLARSHVRTRIRTSARPRIRTPRARCRAASPPRCRTTACRTTASDADTQS